MSRKSKPSKQKKSVITSSPPVDKYLDLIGQQIFQGNYAEAVTHCERLLNYLPRHAPQRVDVLAQLGTAQAMLQNFPQSYKALTQALALDPKNAELWYNRSTASCFTSRFGQALWDIERAIELNTSSELTERLNQELQFSRKLAEESRKLRGPDFTLDQLVRARKPLSAGFDIDGGREGRGSTTGFSSINCYG